MAYASTEKPVDYVIATGRQSSVRDFVELTAKKIGWNKTSSGSSIIWEGEGINEIGRRADTNEIVIKIDPRYYRPAEVETLLGDPSKASKDLGWESKTTLNELVSEMVELDLKEAFKDFELLNKKLIYNFRFFNMTYKINKNDKIFIAGGTGMVGSAIKRELMNKGYGIPRNEILTPTRSELNLLIYMK